MKLTGIEYKELYDALLEAYVNYTDLKVMVRVHLEMNLKAEAGEGKLKDVISELIDEAEANGQIEKLIKGAYAEKPDNAKLSALYQNKFPFASQIISVITCEQWDNLSLILSEINYDILEEICRKTLSCITKNIDDNIPQIINLKSLRPLKEVLLEQYPLRQDNIPTIVEFTERLTKYRKIAEEDRSKIEQWLKKITNEKGITLPSYHEARVSTRRIPHLLITIDKESAVSDNFILEAELIPNYQEENNHCETVPIESDLDGSTFCPLDEVKSKISDFIAKTRNKLIREYGHRKNNLTVELFVPIHCFKSSLELEEIPAGNNQYKALGYQYKLVTRCLKRYLINEETNFGEFLTKLEEKWDYFQELLQNDSLDGEPQNPFIYLDRNQIWDEFAVANEWEKKLALNIIGCFSEIENHEIIFNCLLRAGIPISLWHNCQKMTCDEIRQELENILNINSLKTTHTLLETIWRTRQIAHDEFNINKRQNQQVEARNYFGYCLGFLYDHPYRVPSKFNYGRGSDALSGYD